MRQARRPDDGSEYRSVPMNTKTIAHYLASSLVVVAVMGPPLARAATGRTPGAAAVSATGAGTYSIPIALPPGTNSLAPSLALTYNSNGGNGILGVGWSIGGLSSITRCGRTWAQDGESRDVRNDYSDRFCLDGNKLRLTGGGTYGSAGATYQTEIATFAQVTSYGAVGNGPTHFIAQGRDGLIYEYGNTADSRIESVGQSTARAWALNVIRDSSGNAITFTYSEDATNGSYLIASIAYTSNAAQSVAAAYVVEFVPETKLSSEIDSGYIAGSVVKQITRIDRIDVKYGTTVLRRYELTYEGALSSTSKSRLASVQECAGSPLDCFPATTFSYQNGISGLGANVSTSVSVPTTPWPLDVNGDGRSDLVYSSSTTSGSGTWMVMLANGSGGYDTPINTTVTNTNYAGATPIDYNADGFEDLLVPYSGGTWWVMFGNSSGLATPVDTGAPATATGTGTNAQAMDVDGDGLEDLVWADIVGFAGGDAIRYRLRVWGGAFSSTVGTLVGPLAADSTITGVFAPAGQRNPRRVQDFNGDGRGDFVYRHTSRIWDDEQQHYITTPRVSILCIGAWGIDAAWLSGSTQLFFGDFNGDGKTDVLHNTVSGYAMQFSAGTFLTADTPLSVGATVVVQAVLDWDGDGYDDALAVHTTSGLWYVLRSTGEGFATAVSTGLTAGTASFTVADVNGDGLPDLGNTVGGNWNYRTHSGIGPDLLQTATDGFGNSVTFNYAPLTSANYSKYADATYPNMDYRGSMHIVNSYSASNGIGGSFTTSFWYYGARIDLQGRGFAGFYAKRTTDSRNGLYDYQYFRRDFPYTGAVFQNDLYQSNESTLIRRVQNSFTTSTLDSTSNNQRYFPFISSTTALSYELGGLKNGQLISTAVHNYTYDTSGNATNVAMTLTDNDSTSPYYGLQWGSTVAKTISPQPACLGLPTQIAVTNSAPGVPTLIRTTTYTPDYGHCRMSQTITEPASGTYRVTHDLGYDAFGNLSSETVTGIGMSARSALISWGANGRFPISVTNPLSQVVQMGYDLALGVQTSQTDPNNLAVNWTYDGFGRKTNELRPDGTSTGWTYADCAVAGCFNGNNRMTVTQTARNSNSSVLTDQFTYLDQLDRPLATGQRLLSGAYNRVEIRYDALGRVSQQSEPCAAAGCTAYWNTLTYDALDRITLHQRPISATNATLQSTSVAYQGRTTVVTDAQEKSTTKITTVAGAMGRSQDHNGYYQSFTYDAFGSLVSVGDSASSSLFSATYDYGAEAYQRSIADMDLGTRSYVYNALGERTSGSDGKGQSFSATYDTLSRTLTRVEPEGTTTFTYGNAAASHNIGRLQGVSSPGYSEQYTYDSVGRLSNRQIVSDATYAYDYTYNSTTGLPETLTYPTSTSSYRLKLQYLYQNGILQQVKDFNSSTVFWQGNASNPRGQITQETLGNGVITNRALDAVTGWVSNVQSGVGGGATLQNESYLLDLAGNLTQRQNNNLGLTENFYYDSLYRLDHSTLGSTTNLSLTYDAMGNITSRSDVAGGAAWTYHATKKHAVLQAGSTSYTYTYDANGNAQTRNGYGITWTSYNYPSVINGPNKTLTFSYGPDRQRFKQIYTNGSTTETTMYIGGALEKITAGSLIDWRHYIAAGGQTVAVVSRQSTGINATRYVLEDHQGSIAQIADSNGALYVSESFTAFGARRAANAWSGAASCTDLAKIKDVTRAGYTAHEAIGGVSMGLNHMNGRVQDAITGRFLSGDPYVTEPGTTQGFNRYSYVGNNPLSYTDPSGFSTDEPLKSYLDSYWTPCRGYNECPTRGGGGIRPGLNRSIMNIELESRGGFHIPRTSADLALLGRGGGQPDMIPADPDSTVGGTISPYTPLFRDNFAGHVLASFDNLAGLVASPFRDGPTRGLFSNIVLTPRELQDTKFSLVVSAVGPLIGGAANGTKAIAAGATTSTAELIPTHGMTMSRRAFEALKQDISLNGIKSPINFVEANGRKYVLDGHHRVRAARELGIERVPTEQVQLPFLGYRTLDDLFSGF